MQHKPPRLANRMAAIFNPTLPYLGCTGLHGRGGHVCQGHINNECYAQPASTLCVPNFQVGHPTARPCNGAVHVQRQCIHCAPSPTADPALEAATPHLARDMPRGENQVKRSVSRPSGQPRLPRSPLRSPLPLLVVSELSSVVSSKPAASGTCCKCRAHTQRSDGCIFDFGGAACWCACSRSCPPAPGFTNTHDQAASAP